MTNEILFYSQIGSVLAFLATVFVLYRLLVSKKDASIEYLQIQVSEKDRVIADLSSKTESALLTSLNQRLEIAEAEIKRLLNEKNIDENQLKSLSGRISKLEGDVISVALESPDTHIFCRECCSELSNWGLGLRRFEVNSDSLEDYFDYLDFECGAKFENGKVVLECPNA
jgi:hypothetical protein